MTATVRSLITISILIVLVTFTQKNEYKAVCRPHIYHIRSVSVTNRTGSVLESVITTEGLVYSAWVLISALIICLKGITVFPPQVSHPAAVQPSHRGISNAHSLLGYSVTFRINSA